jgi:hypothetical protein
MPIFGITASSNMTTKLTDFYQIATTTLGSAQSTITFSSIPSDYTHLQIRGIARSASATSGDYIYVQFNSDTGNNYTYHQLTGDGSGASSLAGTSQTGAGSPRISAANTLASVFGGVVIDILDYANTNKNKTIRTIGGFDENGAGTVRLTSGVWLNSAAITSVAIKSGTAANLAQYSSFALYGIKG